MNEVQLRECRPGEQREQMCKGPVVQGDSTVEEIKKEGGKREREQEHVTKMRLKQRKIPFRTCESNS